MLNFASRKLYYQSLNRNAMKTFLDSVAADMLRKYGNNLSRVAVVFPNKRASLFLNASLAQQSQQPIWSPAYITISDLFRAHSTLNVGDPIKLVSDLHKSFAECTGTDETLDHFFGWGQLLLADFDDLDKNMADAEKVFANLRDIHELDDISYLTEEQIVIISRFFSNFNPDHNSELKRRFLNLWCKFYDIYRAFNERLERQGLAYEGALYRRVATDEAVEFQYDHYLFVGFNVLQRVEQTLFTRLMRQGKAAFYWDFDQYYMPHDGKADNEAGHYVASYLQAFPNELDNSDEELYGNFARQKSIEYIAAPTESAQAHYISTWLRQDPKRIADGKRTAIVLCDEKLLKTTIHCLPDEVAQVNITTGYPLSQSPFSSLVTKLFELQTQGYVVSSDKFRLKTVASLLSHPYSSYVSDQCSDLLKAITDPPCYYLSRQQLCADKGTTLLFGPIEAEPGTPLSQTIVHWIGRVLKAVAAGASDDTTDPLFQESLFKTYTLVNRLDGLIASGDLVVDVATLQRLLTQLIQATSIPFHGEPAVGLQVMGVLETRNIDFDHVLLLSCNDGNMPKGVGDTSFIPYSIRKAYGLTTVDNKVAIYAYYFHRLLQRATDVTILYNGSASDSQTGEMSRFMQQLLVESGHAIGRQRLRLGQQTALYTAKEIEKNEATIERLLQRFDVKRSLKPAGTPLLTPTAINTYMRCPVSFFYNYVCGLRELEDLADEDMQRRLFGNVFHTASEIIYKKMMGPEQHIDRQTIETILNTKVDIEMAVDQAFAKELFKIETELKSRPEYNGLQLISREVIITYLRRLLEIDRRLAPFDIIALEGDVSESMTVKAGSLTFQTTIGGRIDRLDRIAGEGADYIRVIDYKTGMDNGREMKTIEDVFDPANLEKHSDYYLQTFIYSRIVSANTQFNPKAEAVSPALLFIQNAVGEGYDPTLCLDKVPVRDIRRIEGPLDRLLAEKVGQIFNPETPFVPTGNPDICALCPYKGLCKFFCV